MLGALHFKVLEILGTQLLLLVRAQSGVNCHMRLFVHCVCMNLVGS